MKGRGVEVIDEYDGDAAALLTLMTYEKPRVVPGDGVCGSYNLRIGRLGRVKISGAGEIYIQSFPIGDERLKISWKHEVYRVLIKMDRGNKVKLEIE